MLAKIGERAHHGVAATVTKPHDGFYRRLKSPGAEIDQVDEQLHDFEGDVSQRADAASLRPVDPIEALCRIEDALRLFARDRPPEDALTPSQATIAPDRLASGSFPACGGGDFENLS
jgi:hypothetical protein